jgi:hypothetical protein
MDYYKLPVCRAVDVGFDSPIGTIAGSNKGRVSILPFNAAETSVCHNFNVFLLKLNTIHYDSPSFTN